MTNHTVQAVKIADLLALHAARRLHLEHICDPLASVHTTAMCDLCNRLASLGYCDREIMDCLDCANDLAETA